MKYRAEIDGLRALAVIPVMLFHAGIESFSGGFVGVDVFFVISGYLITTILLEDIENNRFSIVNFYERRARRILPALFVVMIATSIAAWMLMNPLELRKFGNALLGVASFSSNIIFWRGTGYFHESSEFNPLIHTWSLAVEEQYYLLFPIFLILAWKLGKKRTLLTICFVAAVSLLLSELWWRKYPTANFYLAPTRAWELLAGSLTAFWINKRGVKANNTLSLLGFVAIFFSIFAYSKNTPFPSVYALVPVAGVMLLILFAGEGTWVAKFLSIKLIVGIGLISYSTYLWHQPVLALMRLFAKEITLPMGSTTIALTLCMLLGYLSWRYIETPFRKRNFLNTNLLLVCGLASLLVLACIGFLSKQASEHYEYHLAEELSSADYVYFANLDERLFLEGRLSNKLRDVHTLVMGSSRLMQVNSATTGKPTLNLSISAASIEDYVAFVTEAVTKIKPSSVILGVDPWLFNKHSGQNRWKSSRLLFEYWDKVLQDIHSTDAQLAFLSSNALTKKQLSPIYNIYKRINQASMTALNGNHETVGKKAYDGFHIYDEAYATLTEAQIASTFDALLGYALEEYELSVTSQNRFIALIQWLQHRGLDVSIVFSPYHPNLYAKMIDEKPIFLLIESEIRRMAKELSLTDLGSYDPRFNGCTASEFYDGMHPKESCMRKVFGD